MPSDIERIREALDFISPDDRDTWVRMGMAIKSELGDSGFDVWDAWSKQAESYKAADAFSVWKSIDAGSVTAGTLFHEAKANGWLDDGGYYKPTGEEIAEHKRKAEERAKLEASAIASDRAKTADKAAAIWKASAAVAGNPYLDRKGVAPSTTLREIEVDDLKCLLGYAPKSSDVPLTGKLLVVPIKRGQELASLEFIDGAGHKTALRGRGTKTGGYWAAQRLPVGLVTLLIGEGVATMLSAREATGEAVAAALSSGNLKAVARAMRERLPKARLVILADLVKATGEPDPHAIEAARSVGGLLAVPDFGTDRPVGATDFNDMAEQCGANAVKLAIESAKTVSDSGLIVSGVSEVSGVQAPPHKGLPDTPDDYSGVSEESESVPDPDSRPCFRIFDDWLESGGAKFRPGVWYFGIKSGRGDAPPSLTQSWVCSPLHVEAITFDGQDNNFGRLLRFRNTMGRWRDWAMPMELLKAGGDDLRGELLSMGVEIDPSAKTLLTNYLQAEPPKRRMRCALQVGWCDKSFVLPDVVIGPEASGVIFQSGECGHDEHTTGGTLEGWQSEIAALAVGNPLLVLALSASFAGPLLARCNAESGGIHYVGDSSTGKTTAIEAACATWGGPNFRRSWRATANGMEGAAALFNDCLLALDEISECAPKEVGSIVYSLGNGRGKQRASRTGRARSVVRWRCVVLSSGERTISTTMQEGGHRVKAGQAVRLLDIPSVRTFGAWDDLHGMASGTAFSDAIKQSAVTHHGHAGRAFLERLTRDARDFCDYLERIKALPGFGGGEGQDKRAASRFALYALAGELATEYGLTGWSEGAATEAAEDGFRAWRSLRGTGNDERRQILERVSDFIERHGDGRFSDADSDHDFQVRDRAGWWRDSASERTYLFTAEAMREALKGHDFNRALDELQKVSALPAPGADGKRAKFSRIGGRGMKLYQISPDKLGDYHGA